MVLVAPLSGTNVYLHVTSVLTIGLTSPVASSLQENCHGRQAVHDTLFLHDIHIVQLTLVLLAGTAAAD